MTFKVVIPARYASARLPGKPLLEIADKPMVLHVVEKAIASGATEVVVATDDERIESVVKKAGFNVLMTSAMHQSGTDRIAEVAKVLNWQDDEVVVNVQGDEPLIAPQIIRSVAARLSSDQVCVAATACFKIGNREDLNNPNHVKVVLNQNHQALYFSRAPIPFERDSASSSDKPLTFDAYQHVGLYAYRAGFLSTYTRLPAVSLEAIEKLEQLRILGHGYQMAVLVLEASPELGVDTPEDLEKVRQRLS